MKQIEPYFDKSNVCDKKHKLNTCKKIVPNEYLAKIENGCTLETLEEMMCQKFDIYKYGTQITIHGLFSELANNRIGGYVNLIQNKNKSIGVRYTAIDHNKKKRLFELLKKVGNWCVSQSSSNYYIYKMQALPTYCSHEQIFEIVENYISEANKIDTSLFFGNLSCYVAQDTFQDYVVLRVNVCCFYERNFEKLFENLSGMTFAAGQKRSKAIDTENEQKRKAYAIQLAKDRAAREVQEKENQKRNEEFINAFISTTPAPTGYVMRENYTPAAGESICRLYFDKFEKKILWVEMTCKECFGKLREVPTDKTFNDHFCKRVPVDWVYIKAA